MLIITFLLITFFIIILILIRAKVNVPMTGHKDTIPVAGHPYKIISPSLLNTRFVPESGRVPPLVRLPY